MRQPKFSSFAAIGECVCVCVLAYNYLSINEHT